MSIVRAFAAAALVSVAVLMPAGAASAKAVSMDDPGAADVWMKQKVTTDDGTKKIVWSEVGAKQNVDLVATTVTNTKKTISLVSTFSDLDPDSAVATNHFAILKVGKKYFAWGALHMNGQTQGWLVTAGHDFALRTTRIECDVAVDWNFDDDTLTSSFPASCIGKPKSFRFRTEIWAKDTGDGSHNTNVYYDFGNAQGHASPGFSDPVKIG